ncbi:MAG: NAD(P)H-binding protein [Pseudomonadota bacterium]
MKPSSILIIGCGDLGLRTAKHLQTDHWRVHGVRRNTDKLPKEITAHRADYTRPGSLDFIADLAPDFVLATLNPFDRSEAGYRAGFDRAMANILAGLGQHRPRHIIMSSSTRVFAEQDGGWVDESSPLTESDPWGRAIVDAERRLLDAGLPGSVVRFGGIYGIPGGRLLARVRRGELCPPEPISYTNRIHREDCAGFLVHLLRQAEADATLLPVYLGVDDLPAPRYEVESWLARELAAPLQGEERSAARQEATQHNRVGHKRCRNDALHMSGYSLVYPDYRSGYGALLKAL